MSGRLVVVPCGGAKLGHAAPAGALYTGSYHAACRRAALAIGGQTLILSALHGLLALADVIEPYDLRMGQPGSVTAQRLREQAAARGVDQAADVVILAGRKYADAAAAVWPHARRPLDGSRGMGEQLQRLARISREGLGAELN